MQSNKIFIYAGLLNATNTGIGKYSTYLIKSLRFFNPKIIFITRKNNFLRICEEAFLSINSVFFKRNSLCVYSSERDLPFALFSRANKKIIIIHDLRFLTDNGIRNKILRKIFYKKNFSKIICVSKSISNDLKKLGFSCETVYNPIIVNQDISSCYDQSFNLLKKELDFCILGSFEKRKNINFLIKVAKHFTHYKFNIFTSQFYFYKAEKKIINQINLLSNMRLFVGLDDSLLFKEMKKSNIFLSFSDYEGFGRTYIEAQNIGLPVIALKNNVTNEILAQSSFIIKKLSISDFDDAVKEIIVNYQKYKEKSFINSKRFSYENFHKKINFIIKNYI